MKTRAGYAAIIGRPNVGKSTLMNAILGEKLSITTAKPQTTRKRVLGIYNDPENQIIFLDTPGILDPSYLLQEKMMEFVSRSVYDADVIICIIDISEDPLGELTLKNDFAAKALRKTGIGKICVINKVDLVTADKLERLIKILENTELFEEILPVSAELNVNVKLVLKNIIKRLPESPKFYPDDQLSDENERFFVSEIVREKIFEFYRDEVPYSTEVLIEEFIERERGKDYISAVIVVERETQKPIIIGKKGVKIKKLGEISRKAIEEFLQRPVFLEIRVKVRKDWRSNPTFLKSFGYIPPKEG